MRSTFGGIEISKRSLFAHQSALQTTAHNMANANTTGYTRQVVNLVAAKPMEAIGLMRSTIPGQAGMSVEVHSVTRMRERFLDDQFWSQNKYMGEWTIRRDTLENLEAIVNEPSDVGIRYVLGNFWNAWQELSKTPDSMTARAVVKESALALADALNQSSHQLSELSSDLTDAIEVKTTEINMLTDQIAKLNEQIFRIEGIGDNANDLRDQRDVLVDNLSYLVNIDVIERDKGYDINMGQMELVSGWGISTLVTMENLEEAYNDGDLNTGEVRGMFYSRDVLVANYKTQLDTLVLTMATGDVEVTLPKGMVVPEGTEINGVTYIGDIEARTLAADTTTIIAGINGLHQLGYALGDTLQTAPPLFVTKDGTDNFAADNFTLNPDILQNIELFAASARTHLNADGDEAAVTGNNQLALLMAGLRLQKFDFNSVGPGNSVLNGGTLDEYFRAVVGEIGVQSQEAIRNADNQTIIRDQIESRRQSVSGVSLDEEMANMIKFQHAYNAAARAMTSFDEILDKVINGMGIVGR